MIQRASNLSSKLHRIQINNLCASSTGLADLDLDGKALQILVIRDISLHTFPDNLCPLITILLSPFLILSFNRLGLLFLRKHISIVLPPLYDSGKVMWSLHGQRSAA